MDVGDRISTNNASWDFGGRVADTFSDHVRRSVPLYEEGHDLVCRLSDFFVRRDGLCYELGTSTGELTAKLATRHASRPGARFVGIDVEPAMTAKARERCGGLANTSILTDDICLFPYEKADLFVSYYTIQFLPPRLRQPLFDRIFEALEWGGGFIMFEKVRAPDARFQDMMTALYDEFKSNNGFSDEQILNKTRSLKGILDPYTTNANIEFLHRAGFKDVTTVMKYVCFEGFLAIK